MKFTRLSVSLYVGLVFASGAVLGAFAHRAYTASSVSAAAPTNPEEFRKRFLAEMKSRVKLSDEQLTKLVVVLDETRSQFRKTRESIEPEMLRIREEQHQWILSLLKPEQAAEYEKMRKEREERQRQQGNPLPPR
jgi:hypothetical protein